MPEQAASEFLGMQALTETISMLESKVKQLTAMHRARTDSK